jgi:hypothetical protein
MYQNNKYQLPSILQNRIHEAHKSQKLHAYVDEAFSIWAELLKDYKVLEEKYQLPFELKEKTKLYALDSIVVADTLGISTKNRRQAVKVYCLYYLAVHLIDDIVEDPEKFISKYYIKEDLASFEQIDSTIGTSFLLLCNIFIGRILEGKSDSHRFEIQNEFNSSLAYQIKYFLQEKNTELNYKAVLTAKQREVSGRASSFIIEPLIHLLGTDKNKIKYLKKALYYMGSLTQFTDDFRDYQKDLETQNLNLLITLEQDYNTLALDKWFSLYMEEESYMQEQLLLAGVSNDSIELIKIIPLYPFFMKHLTSK